MVSKRTTLWSLFVVLACVVSLSLYRCRESGAKLKPVEHSVHPQLPTMNCHRASGPIRIDGLLDESSWKKAEIVNLQLNNFTKPVYATKARLLWDDKCLYVAFECEDPQPSATFSNFDDPLWMEGNVVEIFVNPDETGRKYYEFEVNPLNTKIDLWIDLTLKPGLDYKRDCVWNADGWKSSVAIHLDQQKTIDGLPSPTGWTVEMAIPLKNFKIARNIPPKIGDVWRINLYRYNTVKSLPCKNNKESCAWSPTRKGFHMPKRFGFLKFVD